MFLNFEADANVSKSSVEPVPDLSTCCDILIPVLHAFNKDECVFP